MEQKDIDERWEKLLATSTAVAREIILVAGTAALGALSTYYTKKFLEEREVVED